MGVEWESPRNDLPGSSKAFGRQLRETYGGAFAGLDNRMIELLELLFQIPSVAGAATDSDAA